MKFLTKLLISCFILISLQNCTHTNQLRFTAIGDTPYYATDTALENLSEVLQQITAQKLSFIVNVGDIFRGWTSCSEDLYKLRATVFAKSPTPFLVTIGDNEFNDCKNAEQAQRHFRNIILANPATKQTLSGASSSFQAIEVTRQFEMIENAAWTIHNVNFIMLVRPDIPGTYPLRPKKIKLILNANTSFLKKEFTNAIQNNRDALVLIIHSDPITCRVDGCDNFNNMMLQEVQKFNKPVLLINGSDHSPIFEDGGYQKIAYWSHLRPGSEPEVMWPEVSFSIESNKFTVKWHKQIAPY